MRKGGGQSKGSSFERKVCKDLSLWLSKGKRKDLLWRSAMSGGRSTVAMKKGTKLKSQAGDISSIDILGHEFIERFLVECKHYKSLDLANLIKGTGKLITFWDRTYADAKQFDKLPMLIAKQNNHPTFVCLSKIGLRALHIRNSVVLTVHNVDLRIMLYDDFLKVNPKNMRQ